jgi:hypothetical protein
VALVGNVLFSASGAASTLIFPSRRPRGQVSRGDHKCRISGAVFVPLFFLLLSTREPALIWLVMSVWAFAGSALYGITGPMLAELFAPRMRCSGISIGYQIAAMLGGAPAPIIATYLIHWSSGATWSIATYLAASSLITLVAVYVASERQSAVIVADL